VADKQFLLEIITPERVLISQKAEMAIIPGEQGDFQVYYGHTPFLTNLAIGMALFDSGGKRTYVALSGGFCEVTPTRTLILAKTAETSDMIDRTRCIAARDRAQDRLKSKDEHAIDEERARLALCRALNRISTAEAK
jgi:F-type H+-transporting ATPase subunit epsilon